MEELRNSLIKDLEIAKSINDEVLIEHITKSIKYIEEKIKEETKTETPVVEENKVVGTITNGNSTLTNFENGNTQLKSDYLDIKVNSDNKKLKIALEENLMTIGLDEIRKKLNLPTRALQELTKIMENNTTEKDKEDIETYLQNISQVGEYGSNLKEEASNIVIKPTNSIDTEYETITKKLSMLEMRLEEITSSSLKDPDDFYDLASAYQNQINEIEKLISITTDTNKKAELENKLKELKDKVVYLKDYAKKVEALSTAFDI